jgi:hypothetical protein
MNYYTELRARYFSLMRRAVQIGALLPNPATIDPDNPADLADVSIILAEFNKVNDEMNQIAGVINGLPDNPTT